MMKQANGKKTEAGRNMKLVLYKVLYVPCVLLDAICNGAAAAVRGTASFIRTAFRNTVIILRTLPKTAPVLLSAIKADMADLKQAVLRRASEKKISLAQRKSERSEASTGGRKQISNPMRKKLFVSTATMVVSAILLVCVSFGQYRITITGELRMPKAADFNSHMYVYPSLDNYNDLNENGIAPATDLNKVNNSDHASESPLHYGQTYASSTAGAETDHDRDTVDDLVYDLYLDEMQPGDEVEDIVNRYLGLDQNMAGTAEDKAKARKDYMTDPATAGTPEVKQILTRSFKFQIENKNANKDGNPATDINQIPTDYTIRVGTDGWIAMKMVLMDADSGKMYYSKRENNTYKFYEKQNGELSSTEMVFSFDSLDDTTRYNDDYGDYANTIRDYIIFVGWDNTYDPYNPSVARNNTSSRSRKQIEVLNVSASLVSKKVENSPFGLSKDSIWTANALEDRVEALYYNTPAAKKARGEGTPETYVAGTAGDEEVRVRF